ncbi:MAG: sugar-binding domain-containing protein [Rikenellaceae bacterium]
MIKRILTTLAAIAIAIAASANVQPQLSSASFFAIEGSPRTVENFNYGWRFYKGEMPGAEAAGFDDSTWEAASLPHGLEISEENASGGRNYQGKAWYRKRFTLGAEQLKKEITIYFEAVMGEAVVWINGTEVAHHYGGYLPFAAKISELLTDGENVVAVMADNSNSTLYPPGKVQNGLDFSYLGGIYRDVYIITTAEQHITLPQLSERVAGGGVFVATLEAKGDRATINIRSEVENSAKKSAKITLKSTLEDINFKEIKSLSSSATIKSGATHQFESRMAVGGVKLWHPEDPALHYIRTEVIVGGKVVDSHRTRFGIRTIEMTGRKGLYINSEPYTTKLIGVNRHQDYVYVGNALPNSGQWRDVKLLREGGSNIIRAGHYPMDDAFYDACDEFGMFVTTANPGWHFFNFKNPLFEQRVYEDTRALVRKDRNRPSMIMWETALNETPTQPDHVMNQMHKIAHEEYPFPGLYTVTDYDEAKRAGLDLQYHGTDPDVNSFTRECGDGPSVDNWYSHNSIMRTKMEWGERPQLAQSELIAETLNSLHSTPVHRLGGALWAGIEHQRGYHPDPFWGGLLNLYRLPKYSYWLYKSQYETAYRIKGEEVGAMIKIVNELTQASDAAVYIYSNCQEVRLIMDGKDMGKIAPSADKRYQHMPHAPFIFEDAFSLYNFKTPGRNKAFVAEVVAEGYINGEKVAEDRRLYPLRSEALALEVDYAGAELTADGSDLIPVRATIVDINGTPKVLASEYVHFTIEGEGEIIGSSANFANPFKTQFGKATILVRASTTAGKIKVTASASGLKGASIEFESKSATMPMLYDSSYAAASKKAEGDRVIIIEKQGDKGSSSAKMQEEILRLQQEIVGKDQELMELRSTINQD